MTRKRYKKLIRALMTDLHTYSKLIEGTKDCKGKEFKRTSMKREKIDGIHPNWDVYNSYKEAWEGIAPVWDSVKQSIADEKKRKGE